MRSLVDGNNTIDPEDDQPDRQHWGFAQRHGLLIVCVSPVLANAIGSVFNILYNKTQIEPLLSLAQQDRFDSCWQLFNVVVYPAAIGCFLIPLVWLRPIHRALLRGGPVDKPRVARARRYVINLPWWFLMVAAVGWLLCIPVFATALAAVPGPRTDEVIWHLVTSFLIASMIAVTQSFFAVELAIQRCLFPVFFQRANPAYVPGGMPLNITARGMMWALSAVVSPVVSLVLLLLVPDAAHKGPLFGILVGIVAIAFALVTGWMLAKLVAVPVRELRKAAMRVADGDLDVRVNLLRADDFGWLIEGFNRMVEGLREREHLQETFGRHVGREAARQILRQGDAAIGSEQMISVMFVDVRNFTEHSSSHSPEEVVAALNVFFREAVDKIESHGGMVNKFLGDGFMALFGISDPEANHALQAVEAGKELLCRLDDVSQEFEEAGWPGLKIGIGINTGPAVVGSIGSPKRQEYTAIGDTVNVASRVETLTKTVGRHLLITDATRQKLPPDSDLCPLPPQPVKGKGKPLEIFAVGDG